MKVRVPRKRARVMFQGHLVALQPAITQARLRRAKRNKDKYGGEGGILFHT
jgi:hypothetical protein